MSSTPSLQSSPPSLERLLESVVDTLGFEIVCLEWAGSGKHRILRIYLDRSWSPDEAQTEGSDVAKSSVDLEDCANVSRLIGLRLDAAENEPQWASIATQLKAKYTLEVSSPGLERPLTKPAHFERFVGRKATIRCHQELIPGMQRKTFHGTLVGLIPATSDVAGEAKVQLQEQELARDIEIPMSAIRKAHLVYEGRI